MFETVVLRDNLNCKILPGHLVVGNFGQDHTEALVAISQSLDKLVIHDPSLRRSGQEPDTLVEDGDTSLIQSTRNLIESESVYYVGLKDVIKTVSVKKIKVVNRALESNVSVKSLGDSANNENRQVDSSTKDLLLIGCSSSVMAFDVVNKSKLFNINTFSPVETISCGSSRCSSVQVGNLGTDPSKQIVCGGQQKIFSLKFETQFDEQTINAELSCERSTGVTINCLTHGTIAEMDVLLVGSIESKILVYQLDTFDHNIQACKLSIDETGPINCICPIITKEDLEAAPRANDNLIEFPYLPAFNDQLPRQTTREQMNYFAYGLDSNFIGVYRLLCDGTTDQGRENLTEERIWRHKCKSTPMSMLMYDINGDGFDELIVGYNNGRLETRSPFTGQLLAATRCFKTDRLAGIAVIDYYRDGGLVLVACSSNGLIIGFKPQLNKPVVPLQGFKLPKSSAKNLDLGDWVSSIPANMSTPVDPNKELEAPQECLVSTENPNDLRIESRYDHPTSSGSDAKQNPNLLQKISSLQNEQMNLENKACQIYQSSLNQASMSYSTDMSIAHSWSLDSSKGLLRLTIVIRTYLEEISLIRIDDENKVYLSIGHLLIGPQYSGSMSGGKKSRLVVVPLRSSTNRSTQFKLSVFYSSFKGTDNQNNNDIKVYQIYTKSIDIPKFAMYMLTNGPIHDNDDSTEASADKNITLSYQLEDSSKVYEALDWIRRNFLCFQFGELIEDRNLQSKAVRSDIKLKSTDGRLCSDIKDTDTLGFEFKFVDARKIISQEDGIGGRGGNEASNRLECKFRNPSWALRIAHSNSRLVLESDNFDLAADLVRLLVIDRLRLKPPHEFSNGYQKQAIFEFNVSPILDELDSLSKSSGQLEESERRIQSELFEAADHTKNLMQQFAIATELNEFATAKELLSESFVMLNSTQNAARAHCLNNKSRLKLCKQANQLSETVNLFTKLSS